jgi:hypothetical protein
MSLIALSPLSQEHESAQAGISVREVGWDRGESAIRDMDDDLVYEEIPDEY